MCALQTSLLTVVLAVGLGSADFLQDRSQFLQAEDSMFLGGDITLSPKESAVNQILMSFKGQEYVAGFTSTNQTFPPARHFFHAKPDIHRSQVFRFIQEMPKGALLHGHDLSLVSTEYIIKNITYRKNLFICKSDNGIYLMKFFKTPDNTCQWQLLSAVRATVTDVEVFDQWLEGTISLVVSDPVGRYPDINSVWSKFGELFSTLSNLLSYRPVFEDYFYQVLSEFYQDNVLYMEFRAVMSTLYELDGTELSPLQTAETFQAVTKRFVYDHPGFVGARVIYAPTRRVSSATVLEYLEFFRVLREKLPDFVAGFDLVGQEDMGAPLIDLLDPILEFQKEGARFFFHAGETNWQGETDMNIVDAILLNTSRIGHGYALNKHPLAMKMVKERGIAVEVNPISNQVLMLVSDLRNHPAANLLANNYPVVIAADDPSLWGAKGLSYDFYEAFMGLAGVRADLRTLKRLALNSIVYSAMPEEEKARALQMWESAWTSFLDEMLARHRNNLEPSPRFLYKTSGFHPNKTNVE